MKKTCDNCRFLCSDGYEDSIYACEFFGEDIPEWADNGNDGCKLKAQEVEKIIGIVDSFYHIGTSTELDECGCPKWTEEDKKHNERVNKKYRAYLEELKKRCERR